MSSQRKTRLAARSGSGGASSGPKSRPPGSRHDDASPAGKPPGFAFGPINYLLFAAAAAAIVAGYVLLSRGSVTAAPLLLVFGYIILIPAALLAGLSSRQHRSTPED
jgi:hypothetical protein